MSGLGLLDIQIVVDGMGEARPIESNVTKQGRALNRRVELEVKVKQTLREKQLEAISNDSHNVSTLVEINNKDNVESLDSNVDVLAKVVPEYNQAWLDQSDNSLEWLLPSDDYNPEIPSVSIAIKHDRQHKIVLQLDGQEVSRLNVDSVESSTDGQRSITRWRGIDIVKGDNQFVAMTYDKNDQVQAQITKTVHLSGQPVRAELIKQQSKLHANGRDPVVVAVRFYDQWGYPARPGVVGEFNLSPEYTARQIKNKLTKQPLNSLLKQSKKYKILQEGIALIEIEPTTRSGKVSIDFNFIDDREQTISAWLTGQQQDWVLVGLAEGIAGYNNISGNAQALEDHQHEDNIYEDGRLAFYGKGQVKGEWLLTLAYDSDRKERNSSERLFQTIDPDEYYSLYGDATEQQFDAASARKLYIKMEREQFYALFGDFNTDLTVTELAQYSRSMTGVKSEFEGKQTGFNVFAADSDQVFVRDEIQGNGTSGLYRLSNQNIVINSEKISIETRDRFQPQNIIEQKDLQQFLDYSIDTVNGTLFFKQPIQSRDENFNPIFIVSRYEVTGTGDRQITAGGRANIFSEDKKIELGVSAIHQGDTATEGHLIGADVTYKFSDQTKFHAEVASSETTRDENDDKGNGYLAEFDHRSEKIDTKIYFRKQEDGFGLEQQSLINDGSKRYGADARYKMTDNVDLNGQVYRDEVIGAGDKRTVAEAEIERDVKQYQLAAGLKYAKDKKRDGNNDESTLATARASRFLFDNKLKIRGSAEVELTDDNSVDYPTRYLAGTDYKLNDVTELFAEHEYTQGEDQDTNTTRVGTRLTPWQQATINTSVEQQASEEGERLFSNLGFVQGWQYNENLALDFSLDRSDTLRNPGGERFNTNVPLTSGTVTDDFTAASIGVNYIQTNWSASSRMEYRTSDTDVQRSVLFGFYREEYTGFGMSLDAEVFDVDGSGDVKDTKAEARYSVAYRPDDSPYTVLNRFDLSYDNVQDQGSKIRQRKVVNNLNLNYTNDPVHQFATHLGLKYNLDNIDGEEYDGFTGLLGFQYRYDVNARLDLSLHGDVLYSTNANNYRYSFGPSVGVNVYKNLWVSVGYNVDGFEDDDFTSAEYTASGPYIKMRFKFDSDTVKSILKTNK